MTTRITMAAAALLALGGCASGSSAYPVNGPARAAADAPERFSARYPAASTEEQTSGGCRSPMMDPRDGTRVRLVSSQGGLVGDYAVPDGRYGVGPGELLRLDCATGRVVGIVPRHG